MQAPTSRMPVKHVVALIETFTNYKSWLVTQIGFEGMLKLPSLQKISLKFSTWATGKVGGEISAEDAYDCARQAALNAIAAVSSVIGDLDAVVQVVKATVFVASTPDFTGQPDLADRDGRRRQREIGERRRDCERDSEI